MSLINKFVRECELMHVSEVPDGQGGTTAEWTAGKRFGAAFIKRDSGEGVTAEKSASVERYTVTVPKRIGLKYHDVVRRIGDGLVLRITSNAVDTSPPACASFAFEQVSAERWELP